MIHFEIGKTITKEGETSSVFVSESVVECLDEWIRKGYKEPEYFIDIWEDNIPVADINMSEIFDEDLGVEEGRLDNMFIIDSNLYKDEETGEPLYWSNTLGWTTYDLCDKFNEDDADEIDLPFTGQWKVDSHVT